MVQEYPARNTHPLRSIAMLGLTNQLGHRIPLLRTNTSLQHWRYRQGNRCTQTLLHSADHKRCYTLELSIWSQHILRIRQRLYLLVHLLWAVGHHCASRGSNGHTHLSCTSYTPLAPSPHRRVCSHRSHRLPSRIQLGKPNQHHGLDSVLSSDSRKRSLQDLL